MEELRCTFCGNIVFTASPLNFEGDDCPICTVGHYERKEAETQVSSTKH